MTSFETVAIIILVILAIAIAVLKSWKNYNDDNEANDEEIKGYVFEGIKDVMSTIEVISGRTVEDTKEYVIQETTKKLTTLREESGINFNLSEGTLTELITAVIDSNFEDDINAYVKECEVCHEEDCACDEASDNIDTGEPAKEVANGDDEADICPEEEDKPAEEVVEEESIEEPFDTLKDDEGNEVDVPAGNVNAEPSETDSVEEEAVEEAAEETAVTEEPAEEPVEGETQDEVHTTEDCTCIECMTKPEIKAWAADHGIFVSSKMLKSDMIEKVKTEFEAQTATE